MTDFKEIIKSEALRLGFSAVGIAPAEYDPVGHNNLYQWLLSGYQSGMSYMERAPRKRYDPKIHMPDARSVIVCAHSYYSEPLENKKTGYVSIYARGEDYHIVIEDKLQNLCDKITEFSGEFKYKIYGDSSPISEKALAVKAGIGFIGRNGTLIIPQKKRGEPPLGSFHFIGVIITDLDIDPDSAIEGTCGKCRRCIDACPTEAIVADRVIDAGRCISYHTTQNKGEFDDDIADKTGNMIFGCDICQIVCPYNKKPVVTAEPRFAPRDDMVNVDLRSLNDLSADEFKSKFRDSDISDIKYEMFKRNIAVVSKNLGK
ncbi:MAG: tRNA epoxyqueuosine(34) reductase QueG [candidate division Zixibacteria bacterium]